MGPASWPIAFHVFERVAGLRPQAANESESDFLQGLIRCQVIDGLAVGASLAQQTEDYQVSQFQRYGVWIATDETGYVQRRIVGVGVMPEESDNVPLQQLRGVPLNKSQQFDVHFPVIGMLPALPGPFFVSLSLIHRGHLAR